jgi:hypothetical protein
VAIIFAVSCRNAANRRKDAADFVCLLSEESLDKLADAALPKTRQMLIAGWRRGFFSVSPARGRSRRFFCRGLPAYTKGERAWTLSPFVIHGT